MCYDSVEAMKSPRVLSTHQLPQSIPEAALMKKRKLILVFRNPKDTALSMFEHFRRGVMGCSNKMEINWDCFIDNFMIGNSKFELIFIDFTDCYHTASTYIGI